jgi:dTDP-4-dehydrorhamnose 3,5-epimerase
MAYSVSETKLPGVLVLTPQVFEDSRGFFFESFNQRDFEIATGFNLPFVQDNHSRSVYGVLRGLHYQVANVQGKLVRVAQGEVFDVAVNLKLGDPDFGKWTGVVLTKTNRKQVWIPPGFAHGFLVLSNSADVMYKTTDYYSASSERCIRWDDSELAITWPATRELLLSPKDAAAGTLALAEGISREALIQRD